VFFDHFSTSDKFLQAKRLYLSSPLKLLLQTEVKKLSDNGSYTFPLTGKVR
jgi:hypothetical protein